MPQNELQQHEQRIIEDLFGKLRQAEHQTGARDPAVEQQIVAALARQPAAPYYMAQAILVQERAIDALARRVQELELELANRPAGDGFLDTLFAAPTPRTDVPSVTASGSAGYTFPNAGAPTGQTNRAGGGFLGSAVQTAMAVTGGVMAANLLTALFTVQDAQAAEPPAEETEPDNEFDEQMMDDGDMGDFDGFDDF